MGLLSCLRSKRATADLIADLKEEVRSVSNACNQWHAKWREQCESLNSSERRADALQAQLEKVTAEAAALCRQAEDRERKLADLQHDLEQCEADRKALADERDDAIKERDAAARNLVLAGNELSTAKAERDGLAVRVEDMAAEVAKLREDAARAEYALDNFRMNIKNVVEGRPETVWRGEDG